MHQSRTPEVDDPAAKAAPSSRRLRSSIVRRAGLVVLTVLASCASKPPPMAFDDAHPRTVAIIPVMPSESMTLDRRSVIAPFFGIIGYAVERGDRYGKQQQFEAKYAPSKTEVAQLVTDALLAAATKRGFNAVVLNDIERNSEDAEDFDYTKIKTTADAVVHVRIRDMGVYNKAMDNDYMPQLDLSVMVAVHRTGDELINENFHYGANASREAFWAVEADYKYRFADFEDVMKQTDLLKESWHVGADQLADRVMKQLNVPTTH